MAKEIKDRIVTLKVEPSTYDKLVEYSEIAGITVSAVIRLGIDKLLKSMPKK